MSEAIRSGAAAVSGGITDRGIRDATQDSVESRQEQARYLRQGTRDAKRQLRQGYRQTTSLYKPYRQAGTEALEAAQGQADSFQFDPSQMENNPAYQFRMNQGIEALSRQYGARGGLGSGNRLIGITDYAQGLASTEYDNEYKRQYGLHSDNFNRNMGIAGMGFNATGAQAQNVNNYRGGIADLIMQRTQGLMGITGEIGDINAANEMGRAGNWAATNMYMGDQAAQGYDHYVPGAGGGSKKSGGGGGGAAPSGGGA